MKKLDKFVIQALVCTSLFTAIGTNVVSAMVEFENNRQYRQHEPLGRIDVIENVPFFVNGVFIDAPNAYNHEHGATMVPLRAIAEALGYTVSWKSETQEIILTSTMTLMLTVGENLYTVEGSSSIVLEIEPRIINDHTYVPISFFTQVMGIDFRIREGTFWFGTDIL